MASITFPKFLPLPYEPRPHILNPESGWAKPRIHKTVGGDWECSVQTYLWHGDAVVIKGRHKELAWAWVLMVDHLVRHDILPTYEATKGPDYDTQ
jgi:hypothetical protein